MTKASDNPFPYMLYVEQGSTPSNPSAGNQRLFVRSSDHVLCMVNSSGVVTPLSGSLTNPMTTTGDVIYSSDNSGTPARLAIGAATTLLHGGTTPAYSGVALGDILQATIDAMLPWHEYIIPMAATPDATVGTWGLVAPVGAGSTTTGVFYQTGTQANSGGMVGLRNTTLAQNDAIAYDVVLAKGTWDCNLWVTGNINTGIVTLNQDGVSQGTVDTYNAGGAIPAKVSITGFTVSTTGKKRMQLLMATKNASSSGYVLNITAIEFRRTA